MKIGSNIGPVGESSGPERSKGTAKKSEAEGASATPSAEVALSGMAALAGTDGAFDANKVDVIAAAMRDGKFTVDAGVVADKLIAQAMELATGKTVQ